jgi:hypothetical protein
MYDLCNFSSLKIFLVLPYLILEQKVEQKVKPDESSQPLLSFVNSDYFPIYLLTIEGNMNFMCTCLDLAAVQLVLSCPHLCTDDIICM